MALHGTLVTFPLTDALRLLTTTRQSGRLQLQAEVGMGTVWMGEGAVVTADSSRVADAPVDEALADLLRWRAGAFAFTAGQPPPADGSTHDTDQLIVSAERLVEEWNSLQAAVPSLDHRITLADTLPDDHVVIDADHWGRLVAVGAGRTVRDLAAALDLTELGVLRVVHALLEQGIATLSPPPTPPTPPTPATPPAAV